MTKFIVVNEFGGSFGVQECEDVPTGAIVLTEGQSDFIPRYAVENGELIDKFPTLTDEEVATELQRLEEVKAAELEAANVATIVAHPRLITPIAFKLRFGAAERVAIYESTDLLVKDFTLLLDDPRLTEVDLALKATTDGIAYLVSKSLLTQARADEILA